MVITTKQAVELAPNPNEIEVVAADKERVNAVIREAVDRGATEGGPPAPA